MSPRALLLALALPVLAACGATSPATTSTAPDADTVAEGFLRPVQVRVHDIGTHVLTDRAGTILYYLASGAVTLESHVGEEVEVRGTAVPLGAEGDLLLSVRSLRTLRAGAGTDEVIEAARRLAAAEQPPIRFDASDPAEVVSSSSLSGITVVRISGDEGSYLIRLVRKPDPVTGDWEIFALEREDASLPPSSASSVPSMPSSTPGSAQGDATVRTLAAALPALEGLSFTGTPKVTKVELSEKRRAYLTYEDGTERGMVLVGWTTDPADASVLAVFAPGDTSEWKRVSGDNVARDDATTIYALSGGAWSAQGTTLEGFALYTSTHSRFSLQYPKRWYYAPLAKTEGTIARVGFAPEPVTDENTAVTLEIVTGTPAAFATKLEPVTINGKQGYQGTLNIGTEVIVLPRDAKTSFLLLATPEGAAQLRTMAGTLTPAA